MTQPTDARAIRGCIVHCLHDPGEGNDPNALEAFEDGLLVIRDGHVAALGPSDELLPTLEESLTVEDERGRFIVPGFIDAHIHYAQTDMIASHGEQLLTWLERYAFPAEARFQDAAVAEETAGFFIDELLRNGTTSALAMGTVHPQSVTPLFEKAQAAGMRLAAGKVMMDRNAPDYLLDDPDSSARQTRELIERWHGVDRLSYAITPRFAPTSSDAQLKAAGELAQRYPDTYIHTHLSENTNEVAWVAELFPWSKNYLDVYDHFGLLRERALYAHSIHLSDAERDRMAATGAASVFCPTSNLFLGSGLFNYQEARAAQVDVALATDVGGGTTFSMIRTMADAYKVAQLTGTRLSPARMLYLATLSGAKALAVDDCIGNLSVGKEADFVVLDPQAIPLLARREKLAPTIPEKLFALFILGDDRCVASTWLHGQRRYQRASA